MGDHIEAVGTVVKVGRTLTVCQLEVVGVQGLQRSLVATGQQTLISVRGRTEQSSSSSRLTNNLRVAAGTPHTLSECCAVVSVTRGLVDQLVVGEHAGAVMARLAAGSSAGRGPDRVSGEPDDHPD